MLVPSVHASARGYSALRIVGVSVPDGGEEELGGERGEMQGVPEPALQMSELNPSSSSAAAADDERGPPPPAYAAAAAPAAPQVSSTRGGEEEGAAEGSGREGREAEAPPEGEQPVAAAVAEIVVEVAAADAHAGAGTTAELEATPVSQQETAVPAAAAVELARADSV